MFFGQSLGAAVALAVAGDIDCPELKAVVAEAPFYSYQRIVSEHIGTMGAWSLLRWLIAPHVTDDRYSPSRLIGKIAPTPVLLIHGTSDDDVDAGHSKSLFEMAKSPKDLWLVDGAGHVTMFLDPEGGSGERLLMYLDAVLKGK